MLTSEGRRYRRVQFKRLVQLCQKEYRKRGVYMRESKIERNMLQKVVARLYRKKEMIDERALLTKQTGRTEHFN